jgi:hypothetical protein
MQKVKDVLRLHLVGGIESRRQIARAVGCGKSAVSDCLRRARLAGFSAWGQIAELDEVELSRRLYRSAGGSTPQRAPARPLPDWARVREELARRAAKPIDGPKVVRKLTCLYWWAGWSLHKTSRPGLP